MSQENVVRGVRYGLYRLFAHAWMQLPLRSRLRRVFMRRFVVAHAPPPIAVTSTCWSWA
jgi:hypothetical protein